MFNVRLFQLACLASVVLPLAGVVGAGIFVGINGGVGAIEISVLACMFLGTYLGIEIGYHRHFAHRSFQASAPVRYFFGALGSMACQGSVLWWSGVHRTHHQFADDSGDPHSPLRGFLYAHMTWLFGDDVSPGRWMRRITDLIRDPVAVAVHRHYVFYAALGFLLPTCFVGWIESSWQGAFSGFLWGGLVRMFLVNHLVYSINSICHISGTRPYCTRDLSRNNYWLMLPSLGFSLHNNHHAFPSSPTTAHQWWQLDVCGLAIRLLAVFGVATDLHLPSDEQLGKRLQLETSEFDDQPIGSRNGVPPEAIHSAEEQVC